MSQDDDKKLFDMFEGSVATIQRRFKRSRRGAIMQLGATYLAIGLALAIVMPIFLPDDVGLSRRTTTISLDDLAFYFGLIIMGLGGFVLWHLRETAPSDNDDSKTDS
ncbi:hypothetical protein [Woodsholea maritima]|uniref:hypothetical protein n=1 Tax=Woodsholea maritima TaxID=240237 RepID=UPI0003620BDD|nr:hypothetical protein [Woodsholea maritima]